LIGPGCNGSGTLVGAQSPVSIARLPLTSSSIAVAEKPDRNRSRLFAGTVLASLLMASAANLASASRVMSA
jgi:hypothetical protein